MTAKRKGKLLLISAALMVMGMAGTTNVVRADGARSAAPRAVMEAPFSWSGLYLGAHSGWSWSDLDAVGPTMGAFSVSHDAPIYGLHVGLQHQFGNFVLGVEGSLSAAMREHHGSTTCPSPNATWDCTARFDDVFTVGPRFGWAMGKWMPYLSVGYANAAFQEKFVLKTSNVGGGSPAMARERHEGWYIGAGVDMALAHGWTIGIDYRHYELDDASYSPFVASTAGPAIAGSPSAGFNNTADVSLDTLTVRVSWKLGRAEAPAPAPMK